MSSFDRVGRRDFLRWIGASAAAGALTACTPTAPRGVTAAGFHASRQFAKTPFGSIAYVERGRGPAAVFLHGFPLNSFQWRGALERLSPYRRCIAPDFLALGYTEVTAGQAVDPHAQAAMIVSLLDTLGVDRFDLVANDSGGAVAQLLVARCPARISSLLLTNCDVEPDSPPKALAPVIELAKRGEFADQWLGRWRADKRLARSPDGIGGMCYADPSQPTDEALDTYFTPLLASPARKALLHAYAIALEHNALDGIDNALNCFRNPVRIVWGMADSIFAPDDAAYLDRTVGHSRGVRPIAGAKLFWPEERPDVLAEEARALWGV